MASFKLENLSNGSPNQSGDSVKLGTVLAGFGSGKCEIWGYPAASLSYNSNTYQYELTVNLYIQRKNDDSISGLLKNIELSLDSAYGVDTSYNWISFPTAQGSFSSTTYKLSDLSTPKIVCTWKGTIKPDTDKTCSGYLSVWFKASGTGLTPVTSDTFKFQYVNLKCTTNKKVYTVKYENTDGSEYATKTYTVGTAVYVNVNDPAGAGTEEKNWSTLTITFRPKGGSINGSTNNVVYTYYAKRNYETVFNGWSGKYYKGDLITSAITSSITVRASFSGGWVGDIRYPTLTSTPSNPKWEGHIFNGWSPTPSIGSTITQNQTYDAQWTLIKYNVIIDNNKGTSSLKTVDYNTSITLPNIGSSSAGTKDIVENIDVAVTYDINKVDTDTAGTSNNVQPSNFTGKIVKTTTFKQWKSSVTINNKTLFNPGESVVITKDVTFTGVWNPTTTEYPKIAVSKFPKLVNPPGFIFAGWYTAKSGGTKVSDAEYEVTKSTTLYAHWTPIERIVKIDYFYRTGTNTTPIEDNTTEYKYTFNTPVTIKSPSNSMGTDYTFYGWADGTNQSNISEDIEDWRNRNGVYPRPSELPRGLRDVKVPRTYNGSKLLTYEDWGQYSKKTGSYSKGDIKEQVYENLYGCWVVSGKYVNVDGTWKKVSALYFKTDENVWKEITDIYTRVGNTWKREVGATSGERRISS